MLSTRTVLMGRFSLGVAYLAIGRLVSAQSLTLDEALQLARQRNGTVQSAIYTARAASSRVKQSFGAFLPTITPSYQYTDDRRDRSGGVFTTKESSSQVDASWRLLDGGERNYLYLADKRDYEAQELTAIQTLRDTLFNVQQQYFEALRADELVKVSELQVSRADTVVRQTEAQVKVGDAPKKDILQAQADLYNARVDMLSARNRRVTATATLKATIGWDKAQPFPDLVTFPEPKDPVVPGDLPTLIAQGLKDRPDLRASRKRIDAQRYDVRRSERLASVNWALDATYTKGFQPENYQNRAFTFSVSLPLFDGFRSREAVRQAKLSTASSKATLTQNERAASAEIESEFVNLSQNVERVKAAKLALDAARQNYEAAVGAQKEGAENSGIVVVLTAQVSLVTAESNYIEAIYDYYISDVRLKLVTGQPLPGEN